MTTSNTPTTADAATDNDAKIETEPQTLLSMLCQEPWIRGSEMWVTVIFQKDGTGELICLLPLGVNVVCAADFLWTATPRTLLHLSSVVHITAPDPKIKHLPTVLVAQLNLEITLLKGKLKRWDDRNDGFECDNFIKDEAFETKVFSLSLEKGNFCSQESPVLESYKRELRYGSRLTFSPSPFPPREEWKMAGDRYFGGHLDNLGIWTWRSFCAGEMEKVEEEEGLVKKVVRWGQTADKWVAGFI